MFHYRRARSSGSINLEQALLIALLVLTAAATLSFLGDGIACSFAKSAARTRAAGWFSTPPTVDAAADTVAFDAGAGVDGPYQVLVGHPGPGFDPDDIDTYVLRGTGVSSPVSAAVANGDYVIVVGEGGRCGLGFRTARWPETQPPLPPLVTEDPPNPAVWQDFAPNLSGQPAGAPAPATVTQTSAAPLGIGLQSASAVRYDWASPSTGETTWRASYTPWNDTFSGGYSSYAGSSAWSLRWPTDVSPGVPGDPGVAYVVWGEYETSLSGLQAGSAVFGDPADTVTMATMSGLGTARAGYSPALLPSSGENVNWDHGGGINIKSVPAPVPAMLPDTALDAGMVELASGAGTPRSGSFASLTKGKTTYRTLAVVTYRPTATFGHWAYTRRVYLATDGYYRSVLRSSGTGMAYGFSGSSVSMRHSAGGLQFNSMDSPSGIHLPMPMTDPSWGSSRYFKTTSDEPHAVVSGRGTWHAMRTTDAAEVLRVEGMDFAGLTAAEVLQQW